MTEFVITLSVVFVTAGLLLLVANQFGLPTVPFYIVAGLIAGQFIAEETLIDLALWGIAFLVFVFAIRLDLDNLQPVLRDGEGATLAKLAVVAPFAFAIGYGLGGVFGFDGQFRNALYFSAAATLSSTLVGSRAPRKAVQNNLVHGRLASSAHFFDALVAVAALLILSAETLTDIELVTSNLGFGVVFILAGLLWHRHGFGLLVRAAGGDEELVLIGSISIMIAFVAGAELAGVSIVIGAFAAGLGVRTAGAQTLGVRNGIESITAFFSAIFFVTVGALVAVPTVEVLVLAATLVVLITAVNPLVHALAFVFEGYDGRSAFLAGFSLNQMSELSLVIAIQALLFGTIAESVFEAIILAAAVTMILAALTDRFENTLYDSLFSPLFENRTAYIDRYSDVDEHLSGHVVVLGYGQQGQQLVNTLADLDCPYVVVENDPARRDKLQTRCDNYVFGDVMSDYPLELAGVSEAQLVVSTIGHRPVSESLLEREFDGDLILRSESSREASELLDAGATFVTVPGVLASDQLVESIERVFDEERETELLRAEHREYFRELERSRLPRG